MRVPVEVRRALRSVEGTVDVTMDRVYQEGVDRALMALMRLHGMSPRASVAELVKNAKVVALRERGP